MSDRVAVVVRRSQPVRRGWKPGVAWCAAGLLAFAAIYRMRTFVPQPLDAPGTLRPHLYSWAMEFVRLCPDVTRAQTAWRIICLLLTLFPAGLALLNYSGLAPHRLRKVLCSRALLFASIGLALVVSRFPVLLADALNPDESEFLAAAHKLFFDPVFFRAVDCGTSGPLNIYPLMLPAVAGFSPDYASSRVVALLIIFASILVLYRTLCLLLDERLVRIAILPVALAFAALKSREFVQYSSEHVSFLLVAGAIFLCVRTWVQPVFYTLSFFGLGLLASAAFFAKMQAVPIVAAPAMVAIIFVRVRWRPVAALLAGAALPFIFNAVVCLSTGVWYDFRMAYLTGNYGYLYLPAPALSDFIEFVMDSGEIQIFSALLVTILVVGLSLSVRHKFAPNSKRFGLLAAAILAASLFAVYTPHREFPHYLLLLIIPINIAVAWPLTIQGSRPDARLVLAFATVVLPSLGYLQSRPSEVEFRTVPAQIRPEEGAFIRSMTVSSDEITVWGWNAQLYPGAGRVAATRDLNMINLFHPISTVSAFYRERFLRDMKRRPPKLFIDATGPTSFNGDAGRFKDRSRGGFETIPEIRSFIESHYVPFTEAYHQHYWIRITPLP